MASSRLQTAPSSDAEALSYEGTYQMQSLIVGKKPQTPAPS
jgi:hypothetical protein